MDLTIYSDGGARPNPGPAGSGYYGEDEDGNVYVWWKSHPNSTNNVGELVAATKAFQDASANGAKSLLLRPDSEYTINTIKNKQSIKSANYLRDGAPMPNHEEVKALIEAVNAFVASGGKYAVKYIPAHSGHYGNEMADAYATHGVRAAQKGLDVEESYTVTKKKHTKAPTAGYSRLVNFTDVYFNSRTFETKHGFMYFTGHHGKDDDEADEKGKEDTAFGKLMPDAANSVVLLKEPESALEAVINTALDLNPDIGGVPFIAKLTTIFSPMVYRDLLKYGGTYLGMGRGMHKHWLEDPFERKVAKWHNPPKLGMFAMENFSKMSDDVLRHLDGEQVFLSEIDITDLLFETKEIKMKTKTKTELVLKDGIHKRQVLPTKLHSSFGFDDKKFKVNIRLNLGHDLPTVNAMQRLRKLNPKFYLLLKQEGIGVKHSILCKCDDGIMYTAPLTSNFALLVEDK